MHILYVARLVLVELRSELKVVPFLMSGERWKGLYVLLLGFVPSAFVFYCVCNICSLFLTVEPTLQETTFSF